jgi:hypothetical protein
LLIGANRLAVPKKESQADKAAGDFASAGCRARVTFRQCGASKVEVELQLSRSLQMSTNVEVARAYIQAIESGATSEALARFFTPDVVIQEMPNRISPRGSVADLAKALQGAERGQQIFTRQSYTITSLLAEGNRVALEPDWVGITAIPIQNLPAGSEMRDTRLIKARGMIY